MRAGGDDAVAAVRLAAAMHWYGGGELTMGQATALAGPDLRGFLTALSREQQDLFHVDLDELQQDLELLAQRRSHLAGHG